MKRLIFTFIAMTFIMIGCSENDIMVKFEEMPTKAQTFVTTHFATHTVQYIIKDRDISGTEYELKFTNGDEISFDKDGEWDSIDCEFSSVPEAVVNEKVLTYIKNNFKNSKITGVEKDFRHYEVELDNDLDLIFNNNFEFVSIDD